MGPLIPIALALGAGWLLTRRGAVFQPPGGAANAEPGVATVPASGGAPVPATTVTWQRLADLLEQQPDDLNNFARGLRVLNRYNGPTTDIDMNNPPQALVDAFRATATAWGIPMDSNVDDAMMREIVRRLRAGEGNIAPTSGVGRWRRY